MNANHPQKPKQKQAGKRRKPAKKGKSAITAKKQAPDLSPEAPKPKHPGGRPPKYKTPEELQEKIEAYFDSCWTDKVTEVTDKEGTCTMSTVRYQDRPYTVAGLAYFLGFEDRQALSEYKAKPEFSVIVKKAQLKIQTCWEEALSGKNATGPIFWLKNHAGYKDSQELKHTGSDGGAIVHKITDLTRDDLIAIASGGRPRNPKKG